MLVLALIVVIGVFSFFYRMYHHDVEALEDFTASYQRFDRAMSDFSANGTNNLENKADAALTELNAKAAFRLSSLIKNDGLIPPLALRIVDLSQKELNNLKVYKTAARGKNTGLAELAKEYNNLTERRKTAYARFKELAEIEVD